MAPDPPITNQPASHAADALQHDLGTILTTMRLQTQLLLRIVRHQRTPDRDRLHSGLLGIDAAISKLTERIDDQRPRP